MSSPARKWKLLDIYPLTEYFLLFLFFILVGGRYPEIVLLAGDGTYYFLYLTLHLFIFCLHFFLLKFLVWACSSYEDWGVDELIVEDSWKRQVGGDWSALASCSSKVLFDVFWFTTKFYVYVQLLEKSRKKPTFK